MGRVTGALLVYVAFALPFGFKHMIFPSVQNRILCQYHISCLRYDLWLRNLKNVALIGFFSISRFAHLNKGIASD